MAAETQIEERMLSFFKQEKYRSLLATAAAQRGQSILVDHSDLISFDEELSHLIVNDPLKYLPILDMAAYKQLQVEDPDYAATLKEFKARIFNIPDRIPIREIRSHHLGKLIAVDGIMVRASTVRPMLKVAVFACSNCGAKYFSSEDSSGLMLRPPERCERCRGRKFEMIPEESEYIDFQLVGVQEKPEDLPPGQIPRVIDIELKGDIVDVARPGDRVIVTGILRTMPERDVNMLRRTSKMYLEAVSIETASKEPESLIITPEEEKLFREMAKDPEIHRKLMDSIAPSLYGLEHVKKAVMLLLFGGRPKQYPDGTRIRGDVHLLLVGDPGTGTSQLLKYVAIMAPRGVYTSGRGSTAAGLCVSGDTLIYTSDGILPIGEVVEKNFENGSRKLDDGIWISENPKIVKLIAPSKDLKRIETHRAIQYYKLKIGKVIRINTILGKSITLTAETPILCSEDGRTLKWKKACEVRVGDHVALAGKIPELEGDWRKCLYELIGDDVFIEMDPSKLNELLNRLSKKLGSLRNAAKFLGVNEDHIYYRWRKRLTSPRLGVLKRILEKIEMNFEDVLPYIKSVAYKSYRGIERIKLPPYPNEDFMEFLGDIYSDGCLIEDPRKKESYIIHYSAGSIKDARNYVKRVRRLFGLSPKIEEDKRENCYVIRFSNKIIARTLRAFGIPVGDKGKDLEIHPLIHVMPRKLIGRFLRQLFTNSGGIVNGKCVFFSTSSKRLAEQVDMLLRRFGIISSIIRRGPRESLINGKIVRGEQIYEISIHDLESLKIFLKKIGFSNSEKLQKLLALIKQRKGTHNNFKRLNDGIILVKVKNVKREKLNEVYDLTINDSHAFIANGFIVHNTAAVVRDSTGGMMLEAGALVLADMGVACIDEIDKMRPEDRVALHEAMAQQTISIAKGGIVATLNARTSILAAANPTLGRYDPYRSFTDNVDLPITILSRFDLIFVLRDEPNRELDEKLTDHVLGLQSRSVTVTSPPIKPEILRKYVAYAKRVQPELTPAAARFIKEFYLQMRSIYQQTSTVTITARQLESLIRLAEARARAALRDYVTEEDVLDVISLVKRSLSEVGIDVETGRPDIDVILTGKPKSLRDKIAIFLDTLRELQEEKGHAEDEELREALKEKGFTDTEIGKILGRLLSEGKIFSPRTGVYRIT
jgi:DNA replicative helicase MCM subunit Mcm2 (Cdc46/Mcm family)